MFEQIPIGALFSNLLSELRGQAERTRAAARSLCEAAWDYQRAVWLFASAHQYGVARTVRDIAEVEGQAVEKMDAATREFTKDYDWPEDLRKVFTKEIQQISLETANVKVFSMTGQYDDMKQSAQQIENACERIRAAARPHTLGLWRRMKELRTVTPTKLNLQSTTDEKRWWKRPTGIVALGLLVTVVGGLILWGITRRYDKATPSAIVEQLTIQPKPQATQPEPKPKKNPPPKSTHDGTKKKVKIEQHGAGSGAVGGGVQQGPCSSLQIGGSNNQSTINCGSPKRQVNADEVQMKSILSALHSRVAFGAILAASDAYEYAGALRDAFIRAGATTVQNQIVPETPGKGQLLRGVEVWCKCEGMDITPGWNFVPDASQEGIVIAALKAAGAEGISINRDESLPPDYVLVTVSFSLQ